MRSSYIAPFLMMAIWILGTLFWWGLAFYPVGGEQPEWLAVARNVCFGTTPESGLPNTAGWMVLILGPLSFLLVGIVAWPIELRNSLRIAWASTTGRALTVALLAAVTLEGVWVVKRLQAAELFEAISYTNPSEEDLPDFYPRTKRTAADFTLVDQSGGAFRLSDYNSETILLTFAFADCHTVCPVLVRQVLNVGSDFEDHNLRIVILTVDPWRDTPKSLPSLAEKWKLPPKAHILSGSVAEVTAVLDRFQVAYQRDEKSGDIAHPSLVYLIEPGGTIAYTFNNAPDRWLRQAIARMASDK